MFTASPETTFAPPAPLEAEDKYKHPPGNGYAPISLAFIVTISVLFSGAYSTLLIALNWKRLGKPERFLPTLIAGAVMALVGTLIAFALLSAANPVGFLFLLIWVVSVIILALWQYPTHRAWMKQYGSRRKMLEKYGCLTSIALWFVSGMAAYAMQFAAVSLYNLSGLSALSSSLRPIASFEGDSVEVTYPRGWFVLDSADYSVEYREFCAVDNLDCLVRAYRLLGDADFEVLRVYDLGTTLSSALQLQAQVMNSFEEQGAEVIATSRLTIDGYDGYQVAAQMQNDEVWSFIFVKPEPMYVLRFALYTADRNAYERVADDFEEILASVEILTGE